MPRGAASPAMMAMANALRPEHGAELRLGERERHHQEAGEARERGRRRVGHRLHAPRIDAHQALVSPLCATARNALPASVRR